MRICLLFAIHSFEWFLSKRSFISNSKRLLVLSFWSRFVGEPITDNHSCNLHLGTDDQEPGREASERRTALVPKKWSPYFCFSLFPRTALEKMESVPIFRYLEKMESVPIFRYHSSLRWFEASTCIEASRGPPSSSIKHG